MELSRAPVPGWPRNSRTTHWNLGTECCANGGVADEAMRAAPVPGGGGTGPARAARCPSRCRRSSLESCAARIRRRTSNRNFLQPFTDNQATQPNASRRLLTAPSVARSAGRRRQHRAQPPARGAARHPHHPALQTKPARLAVHCGGGVVPIPRLGGLQPQVAGIAERDGARSAGGGVECCGRGLPSREGFRDGRASWQTTPRAARRYLHLSTARMDPGNATGRLAGRRRADSPLMPPPRACVHAAPPFKPSSPRTAAAWA